MHLNRAVWACRFCHSCGYHWLHQHLCLCLYLSPGHPQSLLLRRRAIVSGPFGRSSGGTASKICRLSVPAGWGGSCCCLGQVRGCPCKQLTHRHQVVVVVVGNDEWGSAAWKELRFCPGIPVVALRFCFFLFGGTTRGPQGRLESQVPSPSPCLYRCRRQRGSSSVGTRPSWMR